MLLHHLFYYCLGLLHIKLPQPLLFVHIRLLTAPLLRLSLIVLHYQHFLHSVKKGQHPAQFRQHLYQPLVLYDLVPHRLVAVLSIQKYKLSLNLFFHWVLLLILKDLFGLEPRLSQVRVLHSDLIQFQHQIETFSFQHDCF